MADQIFAEFTETVTLSMPRPSGAMQEFIESADGTNRLIIEIAAIHEGLTANFNNYSAVELEKAVESWTSPYPKPIILNHDIYVDAVGRVMAATMDTESDGSRYTKLQVAITDPKAIERVLDQRYLTGSVGGRSEKSLCSVCGKDWSEASVFSMPCKHARGKTYKGKLAYLERQNLSFHEYSFVNAPADKRSVIKQIGSTGAAGSQEDDTWVSSAGIFMLNMNSPEVLELTESDTHNVLTSMKKKEATPLYHQLKGAFLSALAFQEQVNATTKESTEVSEQETAHEDIASVFEQLSSDLAASASDDVSEEEVEQAEEADATEAEEVEENEDAEESEVEEGAEEAPEASAEEGSDDDDEANEEVDSEEASAQGQERPHDAHQDSGFNKPNQAAAKPSKRDADKTRDADEQPTDLEEETEASDEGNESESGTELTATVQALESRVQELEAREQSLLQENDKLKRLLMKNLAERVVDTKIALGFVDADDRAEEIDSHMERSAASLADSLRDLSKVKPATAPVPPAMKEKSVAVDDPGNTDESDEADEDEAGNGSASNTQEMTPEDVLVGILMGRQKA